MTGLVVGYLLTKALLLPVINIFKQKGWQRKNYCGKNVPIGVGLYLAIIIAISSYLYYFSLGEPSVVFVYMTSIIAMGLIGFYDDLKGERKIKGLKGHFNELIKGKVTSGILKATTGLFIGTVVALIFADSFVDAVISMGVIVLFTNAFNLFDLRPGRCFKFFVFISFFLLVLSLISGNFHVALLYPITGALLAYAPYDLKEKVMLGDAGSNSMGIAIGIICVITLPTAINFVLVIVLALLHWYTEKNSLNSVIENNFFLNVIDLWGRAK
ncbi:MAG: hypothetical protein AB1420_00680 [Bacillota bacterium]